MPESESESLHGGAHLSKNHIDALLRLEEGTEDGCLLFENKGTRHGPEVYD